MVGLWLGITHNRQIWFPRMLIFLSKSERFQFQRTVIANVLCALAYSVWWARYEVIYNMTVWRPEVVVRKMCSVVLLRIGLVLPKKTSVNDKN